VFKEQVSSVAQRRGLKDCLEFLREGDALVVSKPDRLARSTAELLISDRAEGSTDGLGGQETGVATTHDGKGRADQISEQAERRNHPSPLREPAHPLALIANEQHVVITRPHLSGGYPTTS
jgi:hypothetical protein